MRVEFSPNFRILLQRFPKNDQIKIKRFVDHVKIHGLFGLEGRNKPSHNVPTNDSDFIKKVKQTQKYNLWHYHIGIPNYDGVEGDKTSEYVLHYILEAENDTIIIVYMSPHPPFELPGESDLQFYQFPYN